MHTNAKWQFPVTASARKSIRASDWLSHFNVIEVNMQIKPTAQYKRSTFQARSDTEILNIIALI